jgi:DNA gyrase subunit A|nr:MAG TPA: DNA topoisomerase 2 beta [Caudoviricetes sp.]
MAEVIRQNTAHKQYIEDLALYTIATNLVRALPDVRDGLKPVARRILYTLMNDEKAVSPATQVKSAAVEGTVMKKYHPHSGTYPTFKTMVNWFEIKQPMMIGQGSFGTVSGEVASAQRYTECCLSPFGLECVCGALYYNNEVVDWNPTYDNKHMEPQYLPVKVPLLLINGILGGIGTGIKADLPSHNMGEVIDATLRLIDDPNAEVVLIPDHCLPCDIIDTDWKNICNKGYGSYRARATMSVSHDKNDYPYITITSLPMYGTNNVVNKIDEGIAAGKFPQIIDVNDESKNDYGVRIVIKLKKGTDVNFVKEALYKYTPCEQSFRVNFEAVYGTELVRLSYKAYLELFIKFATDNKIKEYSARHYVVSTKLHKLDAFIKIVGSPDIDKIINLIKKGKTSSDNELIELLISKYRLTDIQASYIINAQIKQLSRGYLDKYKEEFNKLSKEESWLEGRIANDKLIKEDVKNELIMLRNKYATPRICKVIKVSNLGNIPEGTFKIIITENNYIRKIGENENVNVVKGDRPKFVLTVSNLENILLFDNKGRVFKLPIHRIPIMAKNEPGIDVKGVIKGLTADIISVIYEPMVTKLAALKQKVYVAILSKNNTIKKLDIQDFINVPPSGIIYSKINQDDDIVDTQLVSDNMDLILYSDSKALRIASTDIALLKRNTIGTLGMGGQHGPMEGMSIIYTDHKNPTKYVIVLTESGKINKFSVAGFERSQRNKAGSRVIDLGRGDRIKTIFGASDNNTLNIITTGSNISLPISQIQMMSSVSKGIKVTQNKTDVVIRASIV